jgi:multiple sugar transport system permease protein
MTGNTITVVSKQQTGSRRKLGRSIGNYVLLIGVALFVMLPIFWGIVTSLKVEGEYSANPIKWLPATPQFVNYLHVFTYQPFLKFARNSLFLAVTFSTLTVITSAMSGFAFSRINVPYKQALFQVVIALLIIPNLVTVIPTFMLFSKLKLTNTYWPWILWGLGASPFFIFLFRQFFSAIPKELEDAAEVDGANPFRIFWQIFLPNAKPALATAFILNFIWVWGDYLTPILYLSDRNTTLAVKLQAAYVDPHGNALVTVVMAASVLYTLPLIIMFFLAQKHILQGVVTSGLKG